MESFAALFIWFLARPMLALTATSSHNGSWACYDNNTAETAPALVRLHQDLLSPYVKVRPRRNSSQPVDVNIYFSLSSLLGLDGREGTLTLYGYLHLKWRDDFLVWDPDFYDNTDEIHLAITDIWRPDIGVFNSIGRMMGDFFRSLEDFPAGVTSNGTVRWGYNSLVEATCRVDMLLFPFDRQECKVIYSTLTSSIRSINFTTGSYIPIIYDAYVENGEFEIEQNSSEFHYFWSEGIAYPSLHLNFRIKRRAGFYFLNLVVPCIALFLLGVLAFWLPPDSGERVSLQVTAMLSFSIYQMKMMDYIPNNSPIPILSLIIVLLMLLSGVSIAANVLVLHMYSGDPSEAMSESLHNFIFHFLGKIVSYPKYYDGPATYEEAENSTHNNNTSDIELDLSETTLVEEKRSEEPPVNAPESTAVKSNSPTPKHPTTTGQRQGSRHAAADILNRLFLCTFLIIFLLIVIFCLTYANI